MKATTKLTDNTTAALFGGDHKKRYIEDYSDSFKIKDGSLIAIPHPTKRFCMYIYGPSGMGKSTATERVMKTYNTFFPKREIFLITLVNDPEDFREVKYARVPVEKASLHEIDTSQFKNTLFVFDDTDTILDDGLRDNVLRLRNHILETGRHDNISIVVTTHTFNNRKETKTILGECTLCILFLLENWGTTITNAMKYYFGFDKDVTDKIQAFSNKSRYCIIRKRHPRHVVYSDGFLSLKKG